MKIIEKRAKEISNVIQQVSTKRGKILVKPNIVSCEPYPTTTDPSVLDVVLNAFEVSEVTVADGPAPDKVYYYKNRPIRFKMDEMNDIRASSLKFWEDAREYVDGRLPPELERDTLNYIHGVVIESELAKICEKHGIEMRCFDTDFEYEEVEEQGFKFRIVKLDDFDLIVALPVLKLHSECGFTGARKILFGLINHFDKIRLHVYANRGRLNFMRLIDDLPRIIGRRTLTMLDATFVQCAQEKVWGGTNVKKIEGGLIVGENPYEIDEYARRLLKREDIVNYTYMYTYKDQGSIW